MQEYVMSFFSIALCGSILGMILPENKFEKPLKFIISTILMMGVLTLFGNFFKENLSDIDIQQSEIPKYEDNIRVEASRAIEKALKTEISKIVIDKTGKSPGKIQIEIGYNEVDFWVEKVKIFVSEEPESDLSEYLTNYLGIQNVEISVIR